MFKILMVRSGRKALEELIQRAWAKGVLDFVSDGETLYLVDGLHWFMALKKEVEKWDV